MKLMLYSNITKKQYVLIPVCADYLLIPDKFVTGYHIHPVYHLVFVIDGKGFLENEHSKIMLKPRDIFIVNPDEKHVYSSNYSRGMKHYTVNFLLLSIDKYKLLDVGDFWKSYPDIKKIVPYAEIAKIDKIFETRIDNIFFLYDEVIWDKILSLIDNFHSVLQQHKENPLNILPGYSNQGLLFYSDFYSKFLSDFLDCAGSSNTADSNPIDKKGDSLLIKIVTHLRLHLYEKFDLSGLAASLNYSPGYLCYYFKSKTGLTISQYINKMKINNACDYLMRTDKTITEIASYLNFSSSNHFCNSFKKEKKITPKEYRKHMGL